MKKLVILSLLFFALNEASFAQAFRWAHSFGEPRKSMITAVSPSGSGETYTLGYTQTDNQSLFGFHTSGTIFLSKCDTNGNQLWHKHFGGIACGYDMTVDRDGHIIIVGTYRDSLVIGTKTLYAQSNLNFFASFIASLTPNGDLLWAVRDTSEANSVNVSVTTDLQNNIYVTGIDYDINAYFGKYDASGKKLWKKHPQGVRTFDDIVVDDFGNIYVAGTCPPEVKFDTIAIPPFVPSTGYVTFLVKYNADTIAQWLNAESFGTFTIANQLAISSWGSIIRYRYGSALGNDRIVELFSPNGDKSVIETLASGFNTFDGLLINSLTATKPFGVFYTGVRNDTLFVKSIRLAVTPDTFLYSTRTVATIASPSIGAQAIGADANNIYLGGTFSEPMLHLGSLMIMNSNDATKFENDLFLTQIATDSIVLAVREKSKQENSLALYPNPCTDNLYINAPLLDIQHTKIEIFDLLGNRMLRTSSATEINTSTLSRGVYMLRAFDGVNTMITRFVKE